MKQSPEILEKNQRSSPAINISLLEWIVCLYACAIVVLGFMDTDFRSTLEKVGLMVISGYLGNKIPK